MTELDMKAQINPRTFNMDLLVALVAALFVAAVGRLITLLVLWAGGPYALAHWADDIFTGVVAGIVVFIALRNNSTKRRMIQNRLREIMETNHHIRNAIDVIGSSHLAPTEASRLEMIADSVARIDQTLKEFNVVDRGSNEVKIKNVAATKNKIHSAELSSTKLSRDV